MAIDVSERERAAAELHEAERQRRSMAEALPVAVSYVGADGRCELCNRAFEELHGWPAGAAEGRSIFEVLGPELYEVLRERIRRALGGGTGEAKEGPTRPVGGIGHAERRTGDRRLGRAGEVPHERGRGRVAKDRPQV